MPALERTLTATDTLDRIASLAGGTLPLPRLLVVLAHPDDEVLAFGGRLERLAASRLITVTDGAPADGADARQHGFSSLQAYRAGRQAELEAALRHAGLTEAIATDLPGLDPIPVPDQSAALHLAPLARAVAHAMGHFAPEAVLTHPYEGGHPDHDACAFAVHMALALLAAKPRIDEALPPIVEAPFYHAGEHGSIRTGTFLYQGVSSNLRICELTTEEQANKRFRLACFASQAETLAQFGVEREVFRIAPRYDFTEPPHPGTLFYEQFPWGMTGDQFRVLATCAIAELFPSAARNDAVTRHISCVPHERRA